jgi:hypothetical protein
MGNLTDKHDEGVVKRDNLKPKSNLVLKLRKVLSNKKVREFNTIIKFVRLVIVTGSVLCFLVKLLFIILFS